MDIVASVTIVLGTNVTCGLCGATFLLPTDPDDEFLRRMIERHTHNDEVEFILGDVVLQTPYLQ